MDYIVWVEDTPPMILDHIQMDVNFFGASDINFFGAIPYLMKRPFILTIKKKHKMNLHYHLIFLLLDFDEAREAVELKT